MTERRAARTADRSADRTADPTVGSTAERAQQAPFTRAERMLRFVFRRCMKDKTLKALTRRWWPTMAVTIEGHRFDLHPADNTTEFRLFTEGRLDEHTSLDALLERVAGRYALVYDIGANCGAYTVPLAAAVADGSVVLAFEPSPVMSARLERNLAINGLGDRVSIHRVALGSKCGTSTLHVHGKNHGQSSLRELDRSSDSVEVEQRTLMDFPRGADAAGGGQVHDRFVIKIDVEGREDDVLYPFLDSTEDGGLPDAILLEMVLESSWRRDLRADLLARGYRISLEADGNALFERVSARA